MIDLLRKRWFLLVLVGGLGFAALAPEALGWARRVPPQVIMAASLFLTAWTLESRSLYRTLVFPWPALWAVVISFGLLPLLGWHAASLLPDLDYRIGLMVVVSVPCTLASAVLWTRLAGGNDAAALLSTFLTIGLGCLLTPLWLAWGTGSQVDIDAGRMMRSLALVLLLPVAAGQAVRSWRFAAEVADRHRAAIGVASRLLIVVIVLRAALEVNDRLRETTDGLSAGTFLGTALMCVALHLTALASGFWSGAVLRFNRPDRVAAAIGGSQKTLPVSLYLFDVYFRDFPLAVVPMLCFFIGQLVVDTFIADILNRAVEKKGRSEKALS
jgi:sodium/bile acid cotransporter 7